MGQVGAAEAQNHPDLPLDQVPKHQTDLPVALPMALRHRVDIKEDGAILREVSGDPNISGVADHHRRTLEDHLYIRGVPAMVVREYITVAVLLHEVAVGQGHLRK